jgi:hypothetical protein
MRPLYKWSKESGYNTALTASAEPLIETIVNCSHWKHE